MNVSGPSDSNYNPFRTQDNRPTSDAPITDMGKLSGDYGRTGNWFFRKAYDSVSALFSGKYWQGGWFAPKQSESNSSTVVSKFKRVSEDGLDHTATGTSSTSVDQSRESSHSDTPRNNVGSFDGNGVDFDDEEEIVLQTNDEAKLSNARAIEADKIRAEWLKAPATGSDDHMDEITRRRANSTPDFTAAQRKEIFGENPEAEARETSMMSIEDNSSQAVRSELKQQQADNASNAATLAEIKGQLETKYQSIAYPNIGGGGRWNWTPNQTAFKSGYEKLLAQATDNPENNHTVEYLKLAKALNALDCSDPSGDATAPRGETFGLRQATKSVVPKSSKDDSAAINALIDALPKKKA